MGQRFVSCLSCHDANLFSDGSCPNCNYTFTCLNCKGPVVGDGSGTYWCRRGCKGEKEPHFSLPTH